MKYILTSFIVLAISLSHSGIAQASSIEDLAFDYTITPASTDVSQKNALVSSLTSVLRARGLGPLGLVAPFPVDEIFSSSDLTKSVFLKFGYSLSDSSLLNKVIEVDNGYLYHSKTKDGAPFALMVQGIGIGEVGILLNELKFSSHSPEKKPRSSKFSFLSPLMGVAHADDQCEQVSNPILQARDNFLGLINGLARANPLFAIEKVDHAGLRCLIGVMKGVWDSSGGGIVTTLQGSMNALLNPVQSAKWVWGKTKNFWGGVKAFIRDTRGMINKSFKFLAALPAKEQSELFCRVAAAIGTGALTAFFTGGTLAIPAAARLMENLGKLEREYKGRSYTRTLSVAPIRPASGTSSLRQFRRSSTQKKGN